MLRDAFVSWFYMWWRRYLHYRYLKSDLYRFNLSPSSLWMLLLPVVVVVFVPCLGLSGSYGVWVGDGIGAQGVLMWY